MQAIQTKYLGPTDSRGSRISARCASGSITIGYDDALNSGDNHAAAARQLQIKLAGQQKGTHWLAPLVSGELPDGTNVHVFLPSLGVQA